MNGDEDALVRAVLASGVILPVPAPGFLRFQAAAADDSAGPKALAAAVIDDPALTGALLRVASSPVFRPRSAPRNVLEAVSLLGRTRSLATVASTALRSRCDGLDASAVDSLWRADARAADAAFWACRASSCKSLADLTYLAALLQDVGTVVVLRRTPELAGLLRCAEPDLEAGIHQLDTASGTCHAAAGYLVARNWKLPTAVCEALRLHHDLRATLRAEPDVRHLGLLLAAGRRMRDGPDTPAWPEWSDPVAAELGLDSPTLDALAAGLA